MGEFLFDFLRGGGGVAELDSQAFELAGLADGGGGKLVFFRQTHAFPDGGLGGHGEDTREGKEEDLPNVESLISKIPFLFPVFHGGFGAAVVGSGAAFGLAGGGDFLDDGIEVCGGGFDGAGAGDVSDGAETDGFGLGGFALTGTT